MRDQKKTNVVTGAALTKSGTTVFRDQFPLGQGWYVLDLIFHFALTVGTGTGAIVEGTLNILKNIQLKTDIDGLCVNVPGRALYRMAQYFNHTAPILTTLAATDGTYHVHIPLTFCLPFMKRPEDSLLDTARYRGVELYITLGNETDLLTTPGTAAVVSTVDINIVHTAELLAAKARPIVYPYYSFYAPVNPANQTYIEIEKSPDFALGSAFLFAANSATAGVPFNGTASDNTLKTLQLETQAEHLVRAVPAIALQARAKLDRHLETWPTGWYVMDFLKDGSVMSAIATGDKSKLQLNWVNDTLSTSQVTAAVHGFRQLKK